MTWTLATQHAMHGMDVDWHQLWAGLAWEKHIVWPSAGNRDETN